MSNRHKKAYLCCFASIGVLYEQLKTEMSVCIKLSHDLCASIYTCLYQKLSFEALDSELYLSTLNKFRADHCLYRRRNRRGIMTISEFEVLTGGIQNKPKMQIYEADAEEDHFKDFIRQFRTKFQRFVQ
jgi:hypothetical protein